MSNLSYNERAWAVDVISAVNQHVSVRQLEIRRAGGEHTLKQKGETSLFPDVLLFGDETGARVRHGWEMKFPDTPVDDPETVANAARKAERLGVNSFVIWNVDRANLHVRADAGGFPVVKTWGPIGAKKRADVADLEAAWRAMLTDMLDTLNAYFASGQLVSAPPTFLNDTFFSDFLQQFVGVTAASLKAAADANAMIEAEFKVWWASSSESIEKGKAKPIDHRVLAQAVIVGWINRFLFCHYLKGFRKEAAAVETIEGDTTIADGIVVLNSISAQCDFMQVFRPEVGAAAIPVETWNGLKQLNAFMSDLATGSVQQEALRLALEGALSAARRKVRGQYTTPDQLADLVVALGMEDRTGALLDPCCGTGTIPKAALAASVARGQSHSVALSRIWASDRFQFPLQFTTMALAEPQAMGTPLRVFRADVFSLTPAQAIELADPNDGSRIEVELPALSTIISNLPFIRFETLAGHDPNLKSRFADQVGGPALNGRSDLFAYIILFLKKLLAAEGRVCVIVSNAWLGTDWGAELRARLMKDFDVDAILTSGAGRWFDNADVVTNILSLRLKKPQGAVRNTRFVTTLKPLKNWTGPYIDAISTDLHGRQDSVAKPGEYRIRSYAPSDLAEIEKQVIGWPGFFADVSWIKDLKDHLVFARNIVDIARGERRGWDPLFYPGRGHKIEAPYIRSVLLNARKVKGLHAVADGDAFCCSEEEVDLLRKGHTGAIAWIDRFRNATNGTGVPLVDELATGGRLWYEMRTDTTADFAIGMNPEDRIFTMRLDQRSFVNQRLIRLSVKQGTADLDLAHALLNSSLTIFFIESSGFGRGLGALDITPTKLKEGMKLVDPALISKADRDDIIAAFGPLQKRDVLRIDQEMVSADRINLDRAVLKAINKEQHGNAIRQAVLELYRIRKSVKD